MKKIIAAFVCVYLLSSCSIFHKEKYGCPSDPRSIGAEKLASGDPKATKEASKAKYKIKGIY